MKRILGREDKTAFVTGQDVGKLGGVMQATASLKQLYGERVTDAPLNEPLIVGTASTPTAAAGASRGDDSTGPHGAA